ncbi:Rho-binding antiterminator [Acidithiobacillus sp. IBUN Pt1247-S3]|uniref:Rho-binding antiterminator n=1 Tax=Acidithiobacillus sp. IBUN Pt1247-S3 TaxID=3166642 RepID=UPI0034E47D4D
MANDPYVPISCALHSELELAAMRRRPVALHLSDDHTLSGIIADVWTARGREWLLLIPSAERTGTHFLIDLIGVEGANEVLL